jgi:hypothetical protein
MTACGYLRQAIWKRRANYGPSKPLQTNPSQVFVSFAESMTVYSAFKIICFVFRLKWYDSKAIVG